MNSEERNSFRFVFFSFFLSKREEKEITFTSSNDFISKQLYAERMLTPVLRRCVLCWLAVGTSLSDC